MRRGNSRWSPFPNSRFFYLYRAVSTTCRRPPSKWTWGRWHRLRHGVNIWRVNRSQKLALIQKLADSETSVSRFRNYPIQKLAGGWGGVGWGGDLMKCLCWCSVDIFVFHAPDSETIQFRPVLVSLLFCGSLLFCVCDSMTNYPALKVMGSVFAIIDGLDIWFQAVEGKSPQGDQALCSIICMLMASWEGESWCLVAFGWSSASKLLDLLWMAEAALLLHQPCKCLILELNFTHRKSEICDVYFYFAQKKKSTMPWALIGNFPHSHGKGLSLLLSPAVWRSSKEPLKWGSKNPIHGWRFPSSSVARMVF